ncbi:MAG: oligosaccharide flippase family protein, partial [Anaerolineae bacterium]|nr:oligosaccharide flippase family protein [Anaerolineae bacterium]
MTATLKTVSLHNKVKQGLGWIFWERVFLRGLIFVRLPILANLLDPRDFGLMSIITTIFSFIDVITRTGFDAALIQKADEVDTYLDVGWSLSFIKGIIQTLILLILVQPTVHFYQEPLLGPLFLVMICSVFFSSLHSIRI